MRSLIRLMSLGILVSATAACSSGEQKTPGATPAAAPPAATLPAEATPASGGKIIEITMTTDDKGSYFTPAKLEAKVGDVLRFKLVVGVHNVNFLPDSNPGKSGLPRASDMLQLPGQTFDVLVNWGVGTYYFQCDPHALLGMHGHVTVVP